MGFFNTVFQTMAPLLKFPLTKNVNYIDIGKFYNSPLISGLMSTLRPYKII